MSVSIRAPLARGDGGPPGRSRRSRRFNPRPSCEGRLHTHKDHGKLPMFQSAPLLRGATEPEAADPENESFQSAPLLRGATEMIADFDLLVEVSIRAPLARGDGKACPDFAPLRRFNPRPSCEGRLAGNVANCAIALFQSAPLLRGATASDYPSISAVRFQSAPLLRGATGQ